MIKGNPQIHLSLTLCLACSSSLPPKAQAGDIFLTPCCLRPICPSCLSSNPRLARYNPCLSCLGGAGVISASSSRRNVLGLSSLSKDVNIDGSIRDEDMFVLGDDEDDDPDKEREGFAVASDQGSPIDDPPPSYTLPAALSGSVLGINSSESSLTTTSEPVHPGNNSKPETDTASKSIAGPVYYIKRGDTLQGIALRLSVHGRELCRLNDLPPSTLTTTPHLLHTRTFLKLPLTARLPISPPIPDAETEPRRVRERAAKRLQTLTKEVDWRVAKAYVALADDPEEEGAYAVKLKEVGGTGAGGSNLQARAVDQYLEDQEWEEEQRKTGKGVNVNTIPPFVFGKITA